ncbi:cupin domain-containing protein [Nocardia neocaledoniensis]|uniref:cupin domain-containing protein n=1 Tax=Nocardia neocaledoniensis TaxID=236511 RepID=UPI002455D229|nr:cupin domain-containing protein [Nocardia neocaledoniensis]
MTPIDLFDRALRFEPGGAVSAGERRMAAGPGSWQLAAFRVETAADVHADQWEMHPTGDEAVCCLRGALRLCLRSDTPGEPDEIVALSAGTACVVPRGRWHRIELDGPADLLSIGLREGTRQQPV